MNLRFLFAFVFYAVPVSQAQTPIANIEQNDPSIVCSGTAIGASATLNPVTALIGGKTATVTYSGMTTGLVGLYRSTL